jgi:hypothetical protein
MNVYRTRHVKLLIMTLLLLIILKLMVYDDLVSLEEPNLSSARITPLEKDQPRLPRNKELIAEPPTPPARIQLFISDEDNEQYAKYTSLNKQTTRQLFKTFEEKSNPTRKLISEKFFLIVEYTKIFSQPKFCQLNVDKDLYPSSELFQRLLKEKKPDAASFHLLDKCLHKNCLFSCDKSLGEQADALLFHDTDLKSDISGKVRNFKSEAELGKFMNGFIKFKREPNQVWIFWNDETNHVIPAVDMFKFNYTISYNSMGEVSYGAYGTYGAVGSKLGEEEFQEMVKKEFDKRKQGDYYYFSSYLLEFSCSNLKLNTFFPESIWFVSNCGVKIVAYNFEYNFT